MGSFSTKCHLSGLIINEEDEVIYIPIQYSNIETSSLCYTTSLNISPFYIPIFGKYNGYGSLIPDSKYKTTENFRAFIENKLIHKYISFLKDEYNSIKRSEFVSDKDIIDLYNNREAIPDLSLSDLNDEEFLSQIQNLFYYSHNNVNRFGFILIKKSFLDSYISNSLKKEFLLIEENLNNNIFKDYERYDDEEENVYERRNESLNSHDVSKSLLFFNDEHLPLYNSVTPVMKLLRENRKKLEKNDAFNNFIETLKYFGIIYFIYRKLGKSFYPIINSRYSNKSIYDFNKFFIEYVDEKNKSLEEDYGENKWNF